VSVREGGVGWLGRPMAEAQWWVAAMAQWEGKGEWRGWKKRWATAGPNPEPGQNSKRNSFEILIDFRIWQNFGKLYKEIYEEF
jgi:hypothetical protein